jgi:hypothetical protein
MVTSCLIPELPYYLVEMMLTRKVQWPMENLWQGRFLK